MDVSLFFYYKRQFWRIPKLIYPWIFNYSRFIKRGQALLDQVTIKIPINEFIVCSLLETIEKEYYDVYKFDIIDKFKGIEIEYKSEGATIAISWSETSLNNNKCTIEPGGHTQILK